MDHPSSKDLDLKLAIETWDVQKTWAADSQYVCVKAAMDGERRKLCHAIRQDQIQKEIDH